MKTKSKLTELNLSEEEIKEIEKDAKAAARKAMKDVKKILLKEYKQDIILRYAIQRKSDGKYYKYASAIYPNIESYWTDDITEARLWIRKIKTKEFEWPGCLKAKDYKILTFELSLQKSLREEGWDKFKKISKAELDQIDRWLEKVRNNIS